MATLTPCTLAKSTQYAKPIKFSRLTTQTFKSQSSLQSQWIRNIKPFLKSTNLRTQSLNLRNLAPPVFSSLPIVAPERVSSPEKLPKWSGRAIKAFAMGELEARKLKYPTTGTEALLMGISIEGTSLAAQILRANGITLFKVREESIKLLGKGDMYFFSPEHPPLTKSAQRALDWAIDEKLKSGESGEITTVHLLLAVWSEKQSAGHKIMAALGFNNEKAKELKDLISSKPGFAEA